MDILNFNNTMEIKSKFNINDLAKVKSDRSQKTKITAFEIKEVLTQTCYAGTQIFYLTRAIIAHKRKEDRFKDDSPTYWDVAHAISEDELQLGWKKYREDELEFLTDEEKEAFV